MNMAVRLRAEKYEVRISTGKRDFNPLHGIDLGSGKGLMR